MKKLVMLCALVSAVVFGYGVRAEEKAAEKAPECAACEPSKPDKNHDLLKQFEGNWDATAKFLMEPGKPMVESKGLQSAKITLGGFWLTFDYEGEMAGTPFRGFGMMGYDQQKKKFISTWADSMSSAMMVSEGSCDAAGKAFTMSGTCFCPMAQKDITMKQVYEFKSADQFVMTFYVPGPDGKEMETGTIEYNRKK